MSGVLERMFVNRDCGNALSIRDFGLENLTKVSDAVKVHESVRHPHLFVRKGFGGNA